MPVLSTLCPRKDVDLNGDVTFDLIIRGVIVSIIHRYSLTKILDISHLNVIPVVAEHTIAAEVVVSTCKFLGWSSTIKIRI